jgi:hypothetical protein
VTGAAAAIPNRCSNNKKCSNENSNESNQKKFASCLAEAHAREMHSVFSTSACNCLAIQTSAFMAQQFLVDFQSVSVRQ